jgi:hypothetical protein
VQAIFTAAVGGGLLYILQVSKSYGSYPNRRLRRIQGGKYLRHYFPTRFLVGHNAHVRSLWEAAFDFISERVDIHSLVVEIKSTFSSDVDSRYFHITFVDGLRLGESWR